MRSNFFSPSRRRGPLAALFIAIGVAGAWFALPHAPIDPAIASARNFLVVTRSTLSPRHLDPGAQLTGHSCSVTPGNAITFDRTEVNGILTGRFLAASPNGAVLEVLAVSPAGARVIAHRQLTPAARQSDNEPFFLFLNCGALPEADSRVMLRTASDSPGAIEWRELGLLTEAHVPMARALPLPFLAFTGFMAPDSDGHSIRVHAPGEITMAVPPGHHRLTFTYGYNPAVFSQPKNFSDGAIFRVHLGSHQTNTVFEQTLRPFESRSDRDSRPGTTDFDVADAGLLTLEVDPGAAGNIAFDWLVWDEIKVHINVSQK